jgi:chemotaxis protein MotB
VSSTGRGRRRSKKHEEEEHENHERWLVSYADMMTLLMCLFIVLFAMSQVDQKKFAQLASGLAQSFGTPITALDNSGASSNAGILDALPDPVSVADNVTPSASTASASASASASQVQAAAAQAAAQQAQQVAAQAQSAYAQLAAARQQIESALTAAGYPGAAQYQIDQRGLVVHVVSDGVLYDAESAALRPDGVRVLNAVAPTLIGLPNELRIEGHTNSIPVSADSPFPSNWELSTTRATAVLRYLSSRGVPEDRMSATGYAATRPLVPDSDPTAVTVNRRVDIVLVSTASDAANALLPGLDAAAKGAGTAAGTSTTAQEGTP